MSKSTAPMPRELPIPPPPPVVPPCEHPGCRAVMGTHGFAAGGRTRTFCAAHQDEGEKAAMAAPGAAA